MTSMPRRTLFVGLVLVCLLAGAAACGRPAGQRSAPPASKRTFVIIPNVDDDDGNGIPDAADTTVKANRDDDVVPVLVAPTSPLPEGARLRVEVSKPWDRLSRVFLRESAGGALRRLEGAVPVPAGVSAANGVTLAFDTSEFADEGRDAAFDAKVRFEANDGRAISEEVIGFTVAPFLVSSCLDPADLVHVARTKLTERFVGDLEPAVREAGVGLRTFSDAALPDHDIWMQDAIEIGYATDGRRLMHVGLRGNRGKPLDDLLAESLLGLNWGPIRKGAYRGEAAEWIDWYGNLEVSPPVKVGGRDYPRGRIYVGTQGARAMHPDVIRFLDAQRVQSPVLWLDTSWLVIGHVDETVSWVPSVRGTPYRMLVPSPRLAVEILRKAAKDAPQCVLNRGTSRRDDRPGQSPERRVAAALSDKALMAAQEFVQAKIDGVRRALQEGLGVADADVVEIPVLFSTDGKRWAGRYGAETPNMVNGLQLGPTLIVPDPHGPLVNGTDVLLQAVKDRLEPIGVKVLAVDDFYPYHQWAGEVHCGTNATRRPAAGR